MAVDVDMTYNTYDENDVIFVHDESFNGTGSVSTTFYMADTQQVPFPFYLMLDLNEQIARSTPSRGFCCLTVWDVVLGHSCYSSFGVEFS